MNVLETLLQASVLAAVPLMLAAVGEAIGQRSGLLNLGVEGVMLAGALVAFIVVEITGSFVAGLTAGALVGAVVGLLFGVASTRLASSQIVLGLGIALAGQGATGFFFRERYGLTQPLLETGMARLMSDWFGIGVVGPALFGHKWFVYAAWAGVLLIAAVVRFTRAGLLLRATGDAPFATEAAGVSVTRVRVAAATAGQALAGLGGAALSIVEVGFFTPGMTVGIGFIAIALAMVGRQDPLRIALLALAFGVLRGLGPAIQLTDWQVRVEFLDMMPYVGVIVLVVVLGRRVRLPAALGLAYHREARP
ncbi:MAG: ABC transporter permease [Chloroflexota bacterium]|nr:ABC transporter permease [Chloroflexota bacterium]